LPDAFVRGGWYTGGIVGYWQGSADAKPGPAESKPETKGNDTAGSIPNTTADAPEKKDGCSSSLGAASLAMLLIAGFGAALIGKKR